MDKEKLLMSVDALIISEVNKLFNYMKSEKEDLIQDARLLVYEKLDLYDSEKGALTTFVTTLLRNNLVNIVRKKYKMWYRTTIAEYDVFNTVEEIDYSREYLCDQLEEFISNNSDKLTKKELAFIKLLIARKTFEQIENIMGISRNNRFVLVNHIKKKIKQYK